MNYGQQIKKFAHFKQKEIRAYRAKIKTLEEAMDHTSPMQRNAKKKAIQELWLQVKSCEKTLEETSKIAILVMDPLVTNAELAGKLKEVGII